MINRIIWLFLFAVLFAPLTAPFVQALVNGDNRGNLQELGQPSFYYSQYGSPGVNMILLQDD